MPGDAVAFIDDLEYLHDLADQIFTNLKSKSNRQRIENVIREHGFEMFRNGTDVGECSPFGESACGWTGHASQHSAHVVDVLLSVLQPNVGGGDPAASAPSGP